MLLPAERRGFAVRVPYPLDVVIFGGVAAIAVMVAVAFLVLRGALHRVGSAEALVIYGTREPRVAFRNTLVIPVLQRAEHGYRFESVSIGHLSPVPEPSRFTANSPEW